MVITSNKRLHSLSELRALTCTSDYTSLDNLLDGEVNFENYSKLFVLLVNDFSLKSIRLQTVWKDALPKSFDIGYNTIPVQNIRKIMDLCDSHISHFERLFSKPYRGNEDHFRDLLSYNVSFSAFSAFQHVDVVVF
jgi:hypothetical protein